MEYIIYSVVEIDFHWGSDEPKPSIIHTYADFKEAVTKKDLCKQIASLDKSRKQYQVVSIKVNEATNKALSQIRKKRKDDNKIDFIAEFHEWVKIVKKYLKEALN
jgi:uncharacterized membrane-anchored protein